MLEYIRVTALFPDEYKKDEESSAKAGYSVYRSTVNYYNYFCMLGDRIEVNFSNGKTVNVWIKPDPKPEKREVKTEAELKEIAEAMSETIMIRTYENGNSKCAIVPEVCFAAAVIIDFCLVPFLRLFAVNDCKPPVYRFPAEAMSETIMIRTYENGNSKDTRRKTTKPEKAIIYKIA